MSQSSLIIADPSSIAVAFCFFLFALFYKPTWGATVWVYTSEIFSTNVRAHAVAMASQFQNVTQAVVNQFFPLFLAKCGFYTCESSWFRSTLV